MTGLSLNKVLQRESLSKLTESRQCDGTTKITTYLAKLQNGPYISGYASSIINTIANESCISNMDFSVMEEAFCIICENADDPKFISRMGSIVEKSVPKVRTGAQMLTNIKMRTRKFKTKIHTNFYKNINKMKDIGAKGVNAAKTNFRNNTGISSNPGVNKKDQEKLEEAVLAYENITKAYTEAMILDSMLSNYRNVTRWCDPLDIVRGTPVQESVEDMVTLMNNHYGNTITDKTKRNAVIETTLMAYTRLGKSIDPVDIAEATMNHYFSSSDNMVWEVTDALEEVRVLETAQKYKCFDKIFGDITNLKLDKIDYPELLQEAPRATNTKDLIKQFREDENANASKFNRLIRDILSQDPEEIINGMPDTLKLIRTIIDWTIFLFIPFGLILGPLSALLNSCTDLVVALPRYKKLYKCIKDEIKEVDKEIDKCKDKDKLKKLMGYKSALEKAQSKIGFKIWGANYTLMSDSALYANDGYIIQESSKSKSVKEDSSSFIHDYEDMAITELRAMVENSKKSSNGKSFTDVLSSFKKETSKTPERFKSLLTSFYVQKPEDILEEVPDVLGAIRMFFVIGGTLSINPILALVSFVADYAIKMHLTRKQYEKYIADMEKELKKTNDKLEKTDNDTTKDRLTKYKKELEKNIEKLKEKEDDLYTDEENDKRKPVDTSEFDDDFNFDFDDDFSFEEAANLVVTLEKAVSKNYKSNLSSIDKEKILKTVQRCLIILVSMGQADPKHPTLSAYTIDNLYMMHFKRGDLHRYAVSKSYTTIYSDDIPIREAADFYLKMVSDGIPGTTYGYTPFLVDSGKKYTCGIIYDVLSLEYRAAFVLLKRNSFHGELFWIYCQDKDPRLLEPITIDIEEKTKLKESVEFANSQTYNLTDLILNIYQESDTDTLQELLNISKLCPEFIDWGTLREHLEPYHDEKYLPIRYIPDIQEAKRRTVIEDLIKESYVERKPCSNLYEVANRYSAICPIIEELCYSTATYSGNTLLQEMDILNTFKMAKEKLKAVVKGLGDKEKSISRNIDVSMSQVSRAAEKALTNDNREAVIRGSLIPSASKVIKLGIVTAAGWLINPVITVIGVLGSIAVSKKLQAKERQLILDDIEIEIEMCNRYLKIAEDKNDLKAQKQLLITKRNLERQRQRIKYKMAVHYNQNVGNLKTNGSGDDDD